MEGGRIHSKRWPGIVFTSVSQLSAPKNVLLLDEISGQPAIIQLELAGLQYFYASLESAELDYGILRHIALLLAEAQVEKSAGDTHAGRAIHAARGRQALEKSAEICIEYSKSKIFEKEYEDANPAALRGLRIMRSLYGNEVMELVPAYLIFAEACLGLNRAAQTEELLATTALILSRDKNKGCDALRSQLYRIYSKLRVVQGKYSEALDYAAKDIYYASRYGGPEGLISAEGYYQLGEIFLAMDGPKCRDSALACFDQTVAVYYKHAYGLMSPLAQATKFSTPIVFQPPIDKEDVMSLRTPGSQEPVLLTPQTNEVKLLQGKRIEDASASLAPKYPKLGEVLPSRMAITGYDTLMRVAQYKETILSVNHVSVAEAKLAAGSILVPALVAELIKHIDASREANEKPMSKGTLRNTNILSKETKGITIADFGAKWVSSPAWMVEKLQECRKQLQDAKVILKSNEVSSLLYTYFPRTLPTWS